MLTDPLALLLFLPALIIAITIHEFDAAATGPVVFKPAQAPGPGRFADAAVFPFRLGKTGRV